MRVGIITWHYYPNVGSCLQAFALQKYLLSCGYFAEFINYREFHRPKLEKIRSLLCDFDFIIPHFLSSKINYKFVHFINKFLIQGKKIKSYKELNTILDNYDVFICGSDQIWAPSVFNKAYFLEFVGNDKKKISYAPSIGLPVIPKDKQAIYHSLLSRFDKISIREETGRKLLSNIGIESQVVCDPTFLLSSKQWEEYLNLKTIKHTQSHKPYIYCYFLGKNKNHRELLKIISDRTSLKVFGFSGFKEDKQYFDVTLDNFGPIEFLNYLKNANLVITDSFHGTAFSIIFKKDFYVFERFSKEDPINQNSRIYNILDKLYLHDRLIVDSIPHINSIDYSKVLPLLENFRNVSKKFIIDSLNG